MLQNIEVPLNVFQIQHTIFIIRNLGQRISDGRIQNKSYDCVIDFLCHK